MAYPYALFFVRRLGKADDLRLELVQVLFRHGERTPLSKEMFPTDPHSGSSYEPWGIAQLTNKGKMREYRIGKMLRQRYNQFLGDSYHPDDVYGRSTDISRTKMSLQLVLAGLYPPTKALTWAQDLPWLPIPTHYVPKPVDNLLLPHDGSKYGHVLEEVRKLKEVRNKTAAFDDVLKFLTKKTGMNIPTLSAAYEIFNLLTAQKSMNLSLPDWCTDDVYKTLEDIVALEYEILNYTKELKRLNGGMLIKRFIENMDLSGERENPRKIYLYSGHEVNIAAYTRAHDISEPRLPAYGSAIMFEKLRNAEGKLFVKMILWTGVTEKLITLKLKDCDEICPIDTYLEIVKDVIPSDSEVEYKWDTLEKEELKQLYAEKIFYN